MRAIEVHSHPMALDFSASAHTIALLVVGCDSRLRSTHSWLQSL